MKNIYICEILVFPTHNYPLNLKLQPCMYLQKFDFEFLELVLVEQSATSQMRLSLKFSLESLFQQNQALDVFLNNSMPLKSCLK